MTESQWYYLGALVPFWAPWYYLDFGSQILLTFYLFNYKYPVLDLLPLQQWMEIFK